MSTRATLAHHDEDCLHVHLYHEMHDDCIHLDIQDSDSNSYINIIIPKNMARNLGRFIAKQPDELIESTMNVYCK